MACPAGGGNRSAAHDDRHRTMSSLKELQDLIHEKYGIDPSKLDPHASMRETGGLDSLALAEFLFAIEDHFGITMPDEDANIDTLAELAQLVDKVRAAKTA
jgi:acyl carrier protein